MYFVLVDFGSIIGCAWLERRPDQMDRETTVADIASGQIESVVQVIRVSVDAGAVVDVTGEILDAVKQREPGFADIHR